ncbi:MAG: hypothetical protein HZB34_14290 [Nitrospirae bacterium]|nr:hypothetical protein [Nitrospirota bacterium]
MVITILQKRDRSRRGKFPRAIACLCVLLWIVGSFSTLYSSLTPQWTTPHCPQGQTPSGQQNHSHCVWHCGGIDAQAATGRNPGNVADPAGYQTQAGVLSPKTLAYRMESVPRGPPATSLT